jgi:extracellular factor (EF) 3-hydroxypalmitic acid methyl ester biosynthesis protein
MGATVPPSVRAANDDFAATFDRLAEMARAGAVQQALEALVQALAQARAAAAPDAWQRIVMQARAHPLRDLVHADPFAARCFQRPRGYGADAGTLDFILRPRARPALSLLAEGVHRFTTQGETARALRFRRDHIAAEIDAAATRAMRPLRVFAAGCGSLRECDRMRSLDEGRIAKIVAFDPDAENLEGVRRDYGGRPVSAHQGSVRQLLAGKHLFADMDLVYCAGLMETLPQPSAIAMTRALFATLRPGGLLLMACLLGSLREAAFLEAFLDWSMVLRDRAAMQALVDGIPREAVSGWTYSENPESTAAVLGIVRRI